MTKLRSALNKNPGSSTRPSVAELRARLELLKSRSRFSHPTIDLAPLAPAWARDYVLAVFPEMDAEQRDRLLLAAEAGFLVAVDIGKNGLSVWGTNLARCRNSDSRQVKVESKRRAS